MTRYTNFQVLYVVAPSPEGPCKVGIADNVVRRLHNLQVGNHLELRVYSLWVIQDGTPKELEAIAHCALGRSWIRGEWFDVTPAQAEQVLLATSNLKPFDQDQKLLDAVQVARTAHPRFKLVP